MLAAEILALAALTPLPMSESVAGVAVRRVMHPDLPWVYEADWHEQQRRQAASGVAMLSKHDALASCHWPAALPLARALSRSQLFLKGKLVVEIGCGTGICSIAAAAVGADVLATDIDKLALQMTAAAAAVQGIPIRTATFDAARVESPLPACDVLILSDLFVTNGLARTMACRVAEALAAKLLVVVVDPGRSSRGSFLDELERRGVSHSGFQQPDELSVSLALDTCSCKGAGGDGERGPQQRLWLLDTDEGAPVSYEI